MDNLTVKEAVVIAIILLCFIIIGYVFLRVEALSQTIQQMQIEISRLAR